MYGSYFFWTHLSELKLGPYVTVSQHLLFLVYISVILLTIFVKFFQVLLLVVEAVIICGINLKPCPSNLPSGAK